MQPGRSRLAGRPASETELHALTELALKLDAIRRADKLAAIEERARIAFIA